MTGWRSRGACGFGFIRRVAHGDTCAYVASQRRSAWPDFALREFQSHAGERAIIELALTMGVPRLAHALAAPAGSTADHAA